MCCGKKEEESQSVCIFSINHLRSKNANAFYLKSHWWPLMETLALWVSPPCQTRRWREHTALFSDAGSQAVVLGSGERGGWIPACPCVERLKGHESDLGTLYFTSPFARSLEPQGYQALTLLLALIFLLETSVALIPVCPETTRSSVSPSD